MSPSIQFTTPTGVGDTRARRQLRRPEINITPIERAGRVLIGGAAAAIAVVLLVTATTVVAISLELLLAAAGLDLVITGALGHCPLYSNLGHVPASLRRPQ